MDATDSGSCRMAVSGVSDVGRSDSVFANFKVHVLLRTQCS
jgi:hypothetical protein